jgi:hypothetical protein
MELTTSHRSPPDTPLGRVLVVADWGVDPRAVIAACERRDMERRSSFALVVPAWLHGIDWAGDPLASVPCAGRQVLAITAAANAAGRRFASADIGDPEPVTAIGDVLAEWPADELLICSRPARLRVPHPFDLTHRAHRVTGLPLRRVSVPPARVARRSRLLGRNGHCVSPDPGAAQHAAT